jgi:type IV secretory pathway VirB10-like protein
MTHRKGAIWTERLLLALILGSLIGSLNLIVALNRRAGSQRSNRDAHSTPAERPPTVAMTPGVASSPSEEEKPTAPAVVPKPAEPVPPPPPPVDPTTKILASLSSATARETAAAQQADRRAEALEQARQRAVAESQKWKRRELLVRQQVAALNTRAEELETSANILDAERDVLAHERDALKAALGMFQRCGDASAPRVEVHDDGTLALSSPAFESVCSSDRRRVAPHPIRGIAGRSARHPLSRIPGPSRWHSSLL